MSLPIPQTEPTHITAGTTVKWSRRVDGYSGALGWALSYVLRDRSGAASNITITGTAAADGWLIELPATTTAAYPPAVYEWAAFVAYAGEKYLVERGVIRVLPDPTSATPADARSNARKILAALETTALQLASKTVASATVNGRTYTHLDRQTLRDDIGYWRRQVAIENGRSGRGSDGIIRVRFTPTSG